MDQKPADPKSGNDLPPDAARRPAGQTATKSPEDSGTRTGTDERPAAYRDWASI